METFKIVKLVDMRVDSCVAKFPLIEKFDISDIKVFIYNGNIVGYITNISKPKDIRLEIDFGHNHERMLKLLLECTTAEQDLNIPEVRRRIAIEYIARNQKEYQKDILRRLLTVDTDSMTYQMNMLRRM